MHNSPFNSADQAETTDDQATNHLLPDEVSEENSERPVRNADESVKRRRHYRGNIDAQQRIQNNAHEGKRRSKFIQAFQKLRKLIDPQNKFHLTKCLTLTYAYDYISKLNELVESSSNPYETLDFNKSKLKWCLKD